MSVIGKNSLSFRKKDVQAQRDIGIGFKKIVFAHKATAGDTGINLASLVVPTEMSGLGFTNPSVADITSANLFFYRKNLKLVSSVKGVLVDFLSYTVGSSTRINFEGFTAEDGEIFIGTLDPVAKTELNVVDASPLIATGTLAVGVTDFNVGTPFQINLYPLTQVGAVIVYRNGIQQFRNTNNGLTGGNYYEVSAGAGLGTIIRFNNAPSGIDDNILVVSNGLLAERPDGSMMAAIENIAGQLDQVIPTVAALAGVPETNFQTAPNNVDLKQFGDQVIDHEARLDALELPKPTLAVSGIGALTTTDGTAVFPIVDLDSANSYNATTGEYSVTESGWYECVSAIRFQSTAAAINHTTSLALQINGTTSKFIATLRSQTTSSFIRELNGSSGLVFLTAGQNVRIRILSDFAISTDTVTLAAFHFFSLKKVR